MRKTIALVSVTAACAVMYTAWMSMLAGVVADKSVSPHADAASTQEPPPEGPQPKAVIEEWEYDFGIMSIGDVEKKAFTVRNEGKAPLVLEKGRTTCKCTLSHIEHAELGPGESTEIELEWRPQEVDRSFRQSAIIRTNDPLRPALRFTVFGRVELLFVMNPVDQWWLGEISGDEPATASGTLYSVVVDDFDVLGIESSSERLSATVTPLSREKLDSLGAKCGYAIHVRLEPGFPVGPIRERLTLKTNIVENHQLAFRVEAVRPQPMRLIGRNWSPQQRVLHMGLFKARQGKRVSASLLVDTAQVSGEFQIERIEVDHPGLKVSAVADRTFSDDRRKMYRLLFELAAGGPPAKRRADNPVEVKVITNHPLEREFDVAVAFVSY